MTCCSFPPSLAQLDNSSMPFTQIRSFRESTLCCQIAKLTYWICVRRPVMHSDGSCVGRAHLSEFPKRQVAFRCAQSQPRAGWPGRADPPALPFAAILRRRFDRYVLTGLPPTNEGEHPCRFLSQSFRIHPAYPARVFRCSRRSGPLARCFIIKPFVTRCSR